MLVSENDYVEADRRPHGLIELVFGEDSFIFPTCLPWWLNWPLLQAFLEPISPRDHFGIRVQGYCNGNRLSQRLVRCGNGFFVQVHYDSTPFLLNELFQSAHLQANTLHTVGGIPIAGRVRWSMVYIAGGYTLIVSRHYEMIDAHSKLELIGGLQHRFPDLVSENFDLVKVHPSMHAMDPVANLARQRYVVVPVEGDLHVIVVLKLDLPPYQDIGAILAPPVLDKGRLSEQTGIDLVCGPKGELCSCYHNGWELRSDEEAMMHDGDFIVCWFDSDPKESSDRGASSTSLSPVVMTEAYHSVGGCASPLVHPMNPRQ